jgi:hypothetical protein
MAFSDVQICNMALRRLPARTISSLNTNYDRSLSAVECSAAYPEVLQMMLEKHTFDFAVARIALAQIENERASEWGYAYALPDDMADPRRVLPNLSGAGIVPSGARSWLSTYGPFPWALSSQADPFNIPYVIAGEVLFTNEPDAWLEYGRKSVPAGELPATFATAFSLCLAERLCMPILKDDKREQKLAGLAELEWQRAIADDYNRIPRRDEAFPSSEEVARAGGWSDDFAPYGVPFNGQIGGF